MLHIPNDLFFNICQYYEIKCYFTILFSFKCCLNNYCSRDLCTLLKQDNEVYDLKSNRKEDLSRPPIVVDGKVLNTKSIAAQTLALHQVLKPSNDSSHQITLQPSLSTVADDLWGLSSVVRSFISETVPTSSVPPTVPTKQQDWIIHLTAPDDVHSLRSAEVSLDYFSFVIPPVEQSPSNFSVNCTPSTPLSRVTSSVSYAMNSITAPSLSQMTLSPVELPMYYADDQKAAKDAKRKRAKSKLPTIDTFQAMGSSEFKKSMEFMRKLDDNEDKNKPQSSLLNKSTSVKDDIAKKDKSEDNEKKEVTEKKVIPKKFRLLNKKPNEYVNPNLLKMNSISNSLEKNSISKYDNENEMTINENIEDIKLFNKNKNKRIRLDSLHPSKSPHRRNSKKVIVSSINESKKDKNRRQSFNSRPDAGVLNKIKNPSGDYSPFYNENHYRKKGSNAHSVSMNHYDEHDEFTSRQSNDSTIDSTGNKGRVDLKYPPQYGTNHESYYYDNDSENNEKDNMKLRKLNNIMDLRKKKITNNSFNKDYSSDTPESKMSMLVNDFIEKSNKITNSHRFKTKKKTNIANKKVRISSNSPKRIPQSYEQSTKSSRNRSTDVKLIYQPKKNKHTAYMYDLQERIKNSQKGRESKHKSKKNNKMKSGKDVSIDSFSESESSDGDYALHSAITIDKDGNSIVNNENMIECNDNIKANNLSTTISIDNSENNQLQNIYPNYSDLEFSEHNDNTVQSKDLNENSSLFFSSFQTSIPITECQVLLSNTPSEPKCVFDDVIQITYHSYIPSKAKHLYSYTLVKSKVKISSSSQEITSFDSHRRLSGARAHKLTEKSSSVIQKNKMFYRQPIAQSDANITEGVKCDYNIDVDSKGRARPSLHPTNSEHDKARLAIESGFRLLTNTDGYKKSKKSSGKSNNPIQKSHNTTASTTQFSATNLSKRPSTVFYDVKNDDYESSSGDIFNMISSRKSNNENTNSELTTERPMNTLDSRITIMEKPLQAKEAHLLYVANTVKQSNHLTAAVDSTLVDHKPPVYKALPQLRDIGTETIDSFELNRELSQEIEAAKLALSITQKLEDVIKQPKKDTSIKTQKQNTKSQSYTPKDDESNLCFNCSKDLNVKIANTKATVKQISASNSATSIEFTQSQSSDDSVLESPQLSLLLRHCHRKYIKEGKRSLLSSHKQRANSRNQPKSSSRRKKRSTLHDTLKPNEMLSNPKHNTTQIKENTNEISLNKQPKEYIVKLDIGDFAERLGKTICDIGDKKDKQLCTMLQNTCQQQHVIKKQSNSIPMKQYYNAPVTSKLPKSPPMDEPKYRASDFDKDLVDFYSMCKDGGHETRKVYHSDTSSSDGFEVQNIISDNNNYKLTSFYTGDLNNNSSVEYHRKNDPVESSPIANDSSTTLTSEIAGDFTLISEIDNLQFSDNIDEQDLVHNHHLSDFTNSDDNDLHPINNNQSLKNNDYGFNPDWSDSTIDHYSNQNATIVDDGIIYPSSMDAFQPVINGLGDEGVTTNQLIAVKDIMSYVEFSSNQCPRRSGDIQKEKEMKRIKKKSQKQSYFSDDLDRLETLFKLEMF